MPPGAAGTGSRADLAETDSAETDLADTRVPTASRVVSFLGHAPGAAGARFACAAGTLRDPLREPATLGKLTAARRAAIRASDLSAHPRPRESEKQ